MDNCFTGRRDWSRQTTEKVILYKIPAGPVTECTFARCRLVHTSCLDRMTSRRLFRLARECTDVFFAVCVCNARILRTTTNFHFIFYYKEYLLLLELLWRPLDKRAGRVAMLWLCLIRILNVHAVMIRVLVTTLVLRRNSARYVTIYLNNRSYSWPPLPTG